MVALRTDYLLQVRSYEAHSRGFSGAFCFLNWFQEAAHANCTTLGFGAEYCRNTGVFWALREADLWIVKQPRFGETIRVTTWVSDLQRVRALRACEARRDDGTLLAQSAMQWVLVKATTLRPTRIPREILEHVEPVRGFALQTRERPVVQGETFTSERYVSFFEEDEWEHVNNAHYVNWIEENARRAARASRLCAPVFDYHHLEYHLPAVKDDQLTLHSTSMPFESGLLWYHEILRHNNLLLRAHSLSSLTRQGTTLGDEAII